MSYRLKIFTADDVPEPERQLAEQRFRAALDQALGSADMVLPVYRLWLKVFHTHGEQPRPWPITPAEQLLADQWEAAELAATQAAFGVNRYLGDADFELGV